MDSIAFEYFNTVRIVWKRTNVGRDWTATFLLGVFFSLPPPSLHRSLIFYKFVQYICDNDIMCIVYWKYSDRFNKS